MPSKNNKKNKNNGNKKIVANEKPAVKKKSAEKTSADTRPHFFDKNKIEFSFTEKKTVDASNFVSPDEVSDKGFVSAHFYHSERENVSLTEKAIPDASSDAPKREETEAHKEKVSASMSELLHSTKSLNTKASEEDSEFAQVFSQISSVSRNNGDGIANIGMKDLLESHLPEKSEEVSDGEPLFAFADIKNTSKEQSLPAQNKAVFDEVKKEKTAAAHVARPLPDSEARRENDAILAALSPEDIKRNWEKEKKKFGLSFIRYAAMAVCLAVLIVSSFDLVSGFIERSREKNKNDEFRDAFNSGEIGYTTLGYARQDTNLAPDERLYSDEGEIYKAPEPEVYDMHEKYVRMLPNLQALKYINSQAFAWIKVEGTRVDYPVVRSPQGDNDYYLSHGIDRTYSMSGAVFTDFNNSMKLSNNKNTCVYGHNMNDGTMFQTIMNFKEKNQFLNSSIELYTTEGIYVYTPFSAYDAIPTESFFKTEFATEEEFAVFLSEIRTKSIFTKPGITLDKNSKVVTLITCTNTVTDKRFVVHGVLEEIVK